MNTASFFRTDRFPEMGISRLLFVKRNRATGMLLSQANSKCRETYHSQKPVPRTTRQSITEIMLTSSCEMRTARLPHGIEVDTKRGARPMAVTNGRSLKLLIILVSLFVGCSDRGRVISGAKDLAGFQEQLRLLSAEQSKELTDADHDGKIPSRSVVIIGDGIAGAAAALNLAKGVRVYGSSSFWEGLQGLPEVWQTNLTTQFKSAGLADPKQFDTVSSGDRIARNAIIAVYLKGLIDADAAYLRTGPVFAVGEHNGEWRIVDTEGHIENANEALIVGTGLLRPRRITDAIPNADGVRRALVIDGKIVTGDDYLTTRTPSGSHEVIGILGAGGSSADCIIHAIMDRNVDKVVVWGQVPPVLSQTKAYKDAIALHGDKICRVAHNFTDISYTSGSISINGNSDTSCIIEKTGKAETTPRINRLIESLGRYEGDPPPVVATAARNRTITYHPVTANSKLIAVRVSFGDDSDKDSTLSKPMYLIGAAATWIPPGVLISASDLKMYQDSRRETVDGVNRSPDVENAAPSFAVAAFMGSQLAIECFKNGHLINNKVCQ